MATLCCSYKFMTSTYNSSLAHRSNSRPPLLHKFPPCPQPLSSKRSRSGSRRGLAVVISAQSSELSTSKDEWLKKLPDKKKPLYAHSLPCIEAWLKSLGFYRNKDDRALWFVENPDWHAQLSLDLTDLYIRYLKSGPGNLEKDIERRFSYALSREDIENAMLGGP